MTRPALSARLARRRLQTAFVVALLLLAGLGVRSVPLVGATPAEVARSRCDRSSRRLRVFRAARKRIRAVPCKVVPSKSRRSP